MKTTPEFGKVVSERERCISINQWLSSAPPGVDDKFLHEILQKYTSEQANKYLVIFYWIKLRYPVANDQGTYTSIVNTAKILGLHESQWSNLCKGFFPNNESAQLELFKAFMKATKNLESSAILSQFAASLSSDDYCIEALKIRALPSVRPLDIIGIVSKRTPTEFASLKNVFGCCIKDAIEPEALENLKHTIGTVDDDLSFGSVFIYFLVIGRISALVKMIRPETLATIHQDYRPSARKIYFTCSENEILQKLGIAQLPSAKELCIYLNNKILPIPSLDESKKKLGVMDEDQKKLNELLSQKNAGAKHVVDFFKTFLGIDDDIKPESIYTYYQFYMVNRAKIAYLFTQEGGAETFLSLVSTITDGCVANIGTRLNIALNQFLFQKKSDAILYDFFINKIAVPLLNSVGDRLGEFATGTNLLTEPEFEQSYLSPTGVFIGLSEQFYINSKLVLDPWEVIESLVGSDTRLIFYETLTENLSEYKGPNYSHAFNQEAAMMASYLILSKAIPSLLNNHYMQEIDDRSHKFSTFQKVKSILLNS